VINSGIDKSTDNVGTVIILEPIRKVSASNRILELEPGRYGIWRLENHHPDLGYAFIPAKIAYAPDRRVIGNPAVWRELFVRPSPLETIA